MRVAGIGEGAAALDAEDAQIGLDALNQLLEDWSTQNLAIYNEESVVYSLVAGQATYTIGPGGDFVVTARPIQISSIYVRYNSIDYPVTQITLEDYKLIPYKSQQGPIPAAFVYDAGFPLGTLVFWMVPNQVVTINVTTNQQLTQLALLSTTLSLPQGYFRSLKYNLAVDLCAEYNRDCPPGVEKIAIKSLANLKRANIIRQTIAVDPAMMGRDGAGWSGSYYANFIAGNF